MTDNTIANPWFLATNAYAELSYEAAKEFLHKGQIQFTDLNRDFFRIVGIDESLLKTSLTASSPEFRNVIREMVKFGDGFLERSKMHSGKEGRFDEQMNRDTGFMQGAKDLTWSYASFATAVLARDRLMSEL